jgi:hypothetical protein
MTMEMILLPLVGLHVLIGIIKVFARERAWLLKTIGGHGEVDV